MKNLDRITYQEIATTPLGQALGDIRGSAVASRLLPRVLSRGEMLFRQGDAGDCLYVVLRGRLSVMIANDSGTAQRLANGPGELVGETALLLGAPRSATVEALEPSVVGALGVAAWRQLIGEFPGWRRRSGVRRTGGSRRRRPDISGLIARGSPRG